MSKLVEGAAVGVGAVLILALNVALWGGALYAAVRIAKWAWSS